MDTTDFNAAASSQPNHQKEQKSESRKVAPREKVAAEKPGRPTRKSIQIEQIILHSAFGEFALAIAKISFELKDIWQTQDRDWVKQISRREIKVVAADSNFLVVDGIRCWQVASSVLPPKTRIEVTVLPAYVEADIYKTLVEELIVTQMIFRSSDAGAVQLVSMYGDLRRDPRFRPILQQIFVKLPTKERFAEILGLRPDGVSQKRKNEISATPNGQDVPNPELIERVQSNEQ